MEPPTPATAATAPVQKKSNIASPLHAPAKPTPSILFPQSTSPGLYGQRAAVHNHASAFMFGRERDLANSSPGSSSGGAVGRSSNPIAAGFFNASPRQARASPSNIVVSDSHASSAAPNSVSSLSAASPRLVSRTGSTAPLIAPIVSRTGGSLSGKQQPHQQQQSHNTNLPATNSGQALSGTSASPASRAQASTTVAAAASDTGRAAAVPSSLLNNSHRLIPSMLSPSVAGSHATQAASSSSSMATLSPARDPRTPNPVIERLMSRSPAPAGTAVTPKVPAAGKAPNESTKASTPQSAPTPSSATTLSSRTGDTSWRSLLERHGSSAREHGITGAAPSPQPTNHPLAASLFQAHSQAQNQQVSGARSASHHFELWPNMGYGKQNQLQQQQRQRETATASPLPQSATATGAASQPNQWESVEKAKEGGENGSVTPNQGSPRVMNASPSSFTTNQRSPIVQQHSGGYGMTFSERIAQQQREQSVQKAVQALRSKAGEAPSNGDWRADAEQRNASNVISGSSNSHARAQMPQLQKPASQPLPASRPSSSLSFFGAGAGNSAALSSHNSQERRPGERPTGFGFMFGRNIVPPGRTVQAASDTSETSRTAGQQPHHHHHHHHTASTPTASSAAQQQTPTAAAAANHFRKASLSSQLSQQQQQQQSSSQQPQHQTQFANQPPTPAQPSSASFRPPNNSRTGPPAPASTKSPPIPTSRAQNAGLGLQKDTFQQSAPLSGWRALYPPPGTPATSVSAIPPYGSGIARKVDPSPNLPQYGQMQSPTDQANRSSPYEWMKEEQAVSGLTRLFLFCC